MALPLAGLQRCRAGAERAGPGACGDWGLAAQVDGVVASPGVGRIAAKGRGQFAPNFGCLLGWETGLQGGGPAVGISSDGGRSTGLDHNKK